MEEVKWNDESNDADSTVLTITEVKSLSQMFFTRMVPSLLLGMSLVSSKGVDDENLIDEPSLLEDRTSLSVLGTKALERDPRYCKDFSSYYT